MILFYITIGLLVITGLLQTITYIYQKPITYYRNYGNIEYKVVITKIFDSDIDNTKTRRIKFYTKTDKKNWLGKIKYVDESNGNFSGKVDLSTSKNDTERSMRKAWVKYDKATEEERAERLRLKALKSLEPKTEDEPGFVEEDKKKRAVELELQRSIFGSNSNPRRGRGRSMRY